MSGKVLNYETINTTSTSHARHCLIKCVVKGKIHIASNQVATAYLQLEHTGYHHFSLRPLGRTIITRGRPHTIYSSTGVGKPFTAISRSLFLSCVCLPARLKQCTWPWHECYHCAHCQCGPRIQPHRPPSNAAPP